MSTRSAEWKEILTRTRSVRVFDRFAAYLETLSPGDKVIAYGLALLVALVAIICIYALEQSLLVRIPAHGGTLTEGEVGSPRFVNPLLAISDADRDLTALTYSGLLTIGPKGTLVPMLADSYTVSPDGRSYTFNLRKDSTFSDGSPVTADDVVFTIQKAQDPGIKSPQFANWSGVTVEAVDPHTVRFTLSKPYAPFLQNMTLGILPAHLWRNIPNEQFPFSALAIQPVGTGPFKFSSMTRDKTGLITSYSVAENSHYAFGRPYLDNVHLTFFSQQEDLVNALKKGTVDSAYGIPNAGAMTAPYSRVFGVFFNPSGNAALARGEVREALSLAINRDAIVQGVLGGYATAILGPVPPGSGIQETSVLRSSDYALDARNILMRGGWAVASTTGWVNKSAKLSLSTLTIKTSNVPELKAVASAVKADWEKLGITIDVELYEPGDLNQNVIRPRKYDALLFGMVIGRDEDLYAFWDSQERNDPGLNIAMYANKTVDALLEDARQTSDETKHLADLQKIEDAVAADYPAAFTHAPDFIYSVPKNLSGVTLPQITTPSDRFSSVANWYLETEAVWPFLTQSK